MFVIIKIKLLIAREVYYLAVEEGRGDQFTGRCGWCRLSWSRVTRAKTAHAHHGPAKASPVLLLLLHVHVHVHANLAKVVDIFELRRRPPTLPGHELRGSSNSVQEASGTHYSVNE